VIPLSRLNFVAVADSAGYVNIWKLPEEFIQHDPTETLSLNTYAEFKEYTAPLEDLPDSEEEEEEEGDDEEEYATLDAVTRAHFPILNERIASARAQMQEAAEAVHKVKQEVFR